MKTQYYTASSLDGFIATEDDSLDSATYEWMLRHAQTVASEAGSAWPYEQAAWIFTSRKLPAIPGASLNFVQGDVRPVHAAMRAAAGERNIWIVGGGDLAGQFHDAGLLDEMIVQVGSVTLGKGKPLFPRRLTSPALELVSARQIGSGFAELRYRFPLLSAPSAPTASGAPGPPS